MVIIKFRPRNTELTDDLTGLIKKAVDLRNRLGQTAEGDSVKNFNSFISGKIMGLLIDSKMIGSDFIICGMYISELLASILKFTPDHWVATDYLIEGLEKNNPTSIQRGANICFLLCSVFQKNAGRCMKPRDYEFLGKSLYYQHYTKTRKATSFCMSQKFNVMSEVARHCIKQL